VGLGPIDRSDFAPVAVIAKQIPRNVVNLRQRAEEAYDIGHL
jgi:hypothetical protein